MSKGFYGLHGLSIKKSAMTKVKARQHVNFRSILIQHRLGPIGHGMVHMAAYSIIPYSMWSHD